MILLRPFFFKTVDQATLISNAFADPASDGSPPKKKSFLEKDARIQEITATLLAQGVPKEYLSVENISAALESNYANGQVPDALNLLTHFYDAIDGKIVGISDSSAGDTKYHRLMGADNRNHVTCYLDSLLFAMFSRLESFEPMLQKTATGNSDDDTRNRENLEIILRLYVNLLRSGQLITTDITKILLGAIIKAGWDESCFEHQQDCCDLFNFITDKLDMPMITLKLDIEHEGKENLSDDHKLVNERLLLVSVPSGSEPVLLEQCLEQYFANSIHVSRQLERRRTWSTINNNNSSLSMRRSRKVSLCIHSPDLPNLVKSATLNSITSTLEEDVIVGKDPEGDLDDLSAVLGKYQRYSLRSTASDTASTSDNPPAYNTICGPDGAIQLPEKPPLSPGSESSNPNVLWNGKNEITLPAWMFLQLVPFYTNTSAHSVESPSKNNGTSLPVPRATEQFATTRPVLGICLKRSEWSEDNQSTLNTRKVLVPSVIHFPSFVADDEEGGEVKKETEREECYSSLMRKHVLVLESAIFHRGTTTESGHFVALARENNDIPYHEEAGYEEADHEEADHEKTEHEDADGEEVDRGEADCEEADRDEADCEEADHKEAEHEGETENNGDGSQDEEEPAPPPTPPSNMHSRWLLFDDLLPAGKKVQCVDYDQVFQDEKPYILFYRLMTVHEFEHEGERHKSNGGDPTSYAPGATTSSTLVNSTSVSPESLKETAVDASELSTPSLAHSESSNSGNSASTKSMWLRPHFTRTKSKLIATEDRPPTQEIKEHEEQVPPLPSELITEEAQPTPGKEKFRLRHLKQRNKTLRNADEYRNEKCIIS